MLEIVAYIERVAFRVVCATPNFLDKKAVFLIYVALCLNSDTDLCDGLSPRGKMSLKYCRFLC